MDLNYSLLWSLAIHLIAQMKPIFGDSGGLEHLQKGSKEDVEEAVSALSLHEQQLLGIKKQFYLLFKFKLISFFFV
jgi:hypothetical protein